jgi:hypothetical protein
LGGFEGDEVEVEGGGGGRGGRGRRVKVLGEEGNGGLEVQVPRVTKGQRGREVALNELAWRMAWVGTRTVAGRKGFLQRSCESCPFRRFSVEGKRGEGKKGC